MLEDNLKRVFTILRGQWTESLKANLGGDSKYEAIDHDQYFIGVIKIIKGVVFKFGGNKELAQMVW